ncbi:MAG: glycosyltransferase family 4 protein [Actinomycetota bacterium]|nr:glycosyltransferase family 4 protein [Actinomycetota bacterium]
MSDLAASMAAHATQLQQAGIRKIHVLAWRDLADPDAGGSELHADEFSRRWADLGFEITHRTSALAGVAAVQDRNGYRVVSRGGRITVFPRVVGSELLRREGSFDAVVEVWNGVPWFSPVWTRRPRLTFLHHVHGPMWDQLLPKPFASLGRLLEARLAPPFYRRGLMLTPSDATRDELIELGLRPDRVRAIPNGVDPSFSPAGDKSPHPSVLAVGRLAPVKRFEALIDAAVVARRRVPALQLHIVGAGPLDDALRHQVRALGAGDYVHFLGHVEHSRLVELYRSAWVVSSASLAEGWGLSLTEGAACGTPAVATDIRGHRSSVIAGHTGVLSPVDQLGDALADLLLDDERRLLLGRQAHARAAKLTWERVAHDMLVALADESVPGRAQPLT